jgi:hypothetical protein
MGIPAESVRVETALKSARQTPESWQEFLDDFVEDPEIIESVKPLNPR